MSHEFSICFEGYHEIVLHIYGHDIVLAIIGKQANSLIMLNRNCLGFVGMHVSSAHPKCTPEAIITKIYH